MNIFMVLTIPAFLLLAFAIFVVTAEKTSRLNALRTGHYAQFRKNSDTELRNKLALQVTKLMDRWQLSQKDQKFLLGIPPEDEVLLQSYRFGHGLGTEPDRLGRIDHLLTIGESLSLIYREDPDQAAKWVTAENEDMEGHPPLDVMKQGYEGLLTVRRYLYALRENKEPSRGKTVRIGIPHPFQRTPEPRKRVRLGIKVTKLLDQWNLSEADQNILLGLLPEDNAVLQSYRSGKGMEEDVDRLGRVGHLLAIGEALSLLYRNSPDRAAGWVTWEGRHTKGRLYLDIMKDGYEGLLAIRRYLKVIRDQ